MIEGTTRRENKKWIWHNSGAIVATVRALLTLKNPLKWSVANAKLSEQEKKYKCMYLLENIPFTNKPLNTWPLDKILLISPCSELCNLHKQQKESKDTKDKKGKDRHLQQIAWSASQLFFVSPHNAPPFVGRSVV